MVQKGIEGLEKRGVRCPRKGTYNGEIDQNDRMDESLKRERENGRKLFGNDGPDAWMRQEIDKGPSEG